MKYVAFIMAGLVFGAFSNDEWGIWVGCLLGFLLAWVGSLSNKINKLESKLLRLEGRRNTKGAEIAFNQQDSSQINPVALKDTVLEDDTDATPELALDVEFESEVLSEHQSDSVIEQSAAADLNELTVEQSLTAQQIDRSKATTEVVPSEPSALEVAFSQGKQKIKNLAINYFTGGDSLVRTGMLVLFVGVAFLLKYVAERTVVPVEARYIGIILGSLLLLGLGWRLRHKRLGFALSLQGGGIGVLYLTLFAALRLHQLLPSSVVLLCLVGIVVVSATLAVLQDSMALAVIGILGGFAAPILTSTGSGSHVQLFTYYLLLNLSIFGIAWFKSWRLLNVVGFISTFAVGGLWGAQYYQPQYFNSVEPFLIAHFLLYVAVAVLFAFKQPPKLKGINDGTIIFGTPIVVFSLQAALVKDMSYGLAYSALVLGMFYVALAYLIKQLHRPFFKDLIESFIALGVGFGTLAIPLGFDGRVTSAIWVAEACALVWVGIRQNRTLPRFSGYILALLGSLAFFMEPAVSKKVLPFLNADFIGVVIIVGASAFMGLYARRHQDRLLPIETPWIPHLMLLAAVAWWVLGGLYEIEIHWGLSFYWLTQLWLLGSALVLTWAARKFAYDLLLYCALVLVLAMAWPLFWAFVDRIFIDSNTLPVFNLSFLSVLVYAVAHFYFARYWLTEVASRQVEKIFKSARYVSAILLLLSLLSWFFNGLAELMTFVREPQLIPAMLVFISASWVLFVWLAHKLDWPDLHMIRYTVTPVLMCLVWLVIVEPEVHPFHASFGILAWLVSFVVNYWLLKVYDKKMGRIGEVFHVFSLFSLAWILIYELLQLLDWWELNGSIWYRSGSSLMLLLFMSVVFILRDRIKWPLVSHRVAYFYWALPLMMAFQWLLLLQLNLSSPGVMLGLPYIPLLNVIDVVGVLTLYLAYKMQLTKQTKFFIEDPRMRYSLFALMGFIMLNASMLRCFHYWYGIEYQFKDMMSSFMVQTGFSVLWAATAVTLMVLAARKKWRTVWLLGLALMIAVVAKLFLIDMSASGSIERIVAFLSVGFLLSVVGYFSPLPPEVKSLDDNLIDEKESEQHKEEK